jgi:WD40 repeat protein/tRNA A-37 threonylcarbamoyl transferase component Bud32
MSELVGQTLQGRYRVEKFIGRGGMAEVYKVWDEDRATHLALKLLREDLSQDLVFLRRFRREAKILAKLQHPNIVRFYELEQDDLLAFLLMDYVDGTSLRAEIFRSRGKGLAAKRILEIMRPVCSALHYAHKMGMVHCDAKPGNIMIEHTGRVLVTDFGIARMSDAATATMVGMGTPAYMAPEQARGQDPTPQTDIYALGVVLFEMLTGGERPFTGEQATITGSTSEKVRWEQMNLEPPPPRKWNPKITHELEMVVLKCLAKDPAPRYGSVLKLLNKLEAEMGVVEAPSPIPESIPIPPVQEAEPEPVPVVTPEPVPELEPAIKVKDKIKPEVTRPRANWKVWIGIAVSTIVFLAVGAGFLRPRELLPEPTREQSPETTNIPIVIGNYAGSVPSGAHARLGKGWIKDISISPQGNSLAVGSSLGIYYYRMDSLEQIRLDETEYPVRNVDFSPDGKILASGVGSDVILWDAGTGNRLRTLEGHTDIVLSVAFAPDGEILASGSYGVVILWDARSGEPLHTLEGHTDWAWSVTFTTDGRTLAVPDNNNVLLWEPRSGERLRTLEGHTSSVIGVAFSPKEEVLASVSRDSTVILWDILTGERLRTLKGHTSQVYTVAFSPNGEILASGSIDETVILWDAGTGEKLDTLEGHTAWVESVAFSPDGEILASGSNDNTVILWNAHTGDRLRTLQGYTSSVPGAAFSPNGETLASGGGTFDNTVILWDARTGERLHTLKGHTAFVSSVAFSPDGKTLASSSADNLLILWDTHTGEQLQKLEGHTHIVESVSFSPDGDIIASSSWDDTVVLWDAHTGDRLRTLEGHTCKVYSVAFSPDSNTLASGSCDNTVILWDIRTGEQIRSLEVQPNSVLSVIFSPDGEIIALGLDDGNVILWKPYCVLWNQVILEDADREMCVYGNIKRWFAIEGIPFVAIFSEDAGTFAFMDYKRDHPEVKPGTCIKAMGIVKTLRGVRPIIEITDNLQFCLGSSSGEHLSLLEGHAGDVYSVAFSHDGETIASGSRDHKVILWDVQTGERLRTLEGHTGPVNCLTFSPTSEILASGSSDGTIVLWDLEQ